MRMIVKESMHYLTKRLPALLAGLALISLSLVAGADAEQPGSASSHVLAAEIALSRGDYLEGAREYTAAAELSESVEIAQEATRVSSAYGFNELALTAAERWLELDEDSDEALFHLARLQLRLGDIRGARKSYKQLIEIGDGDPDERLVSLISVISAEDPEGAYEIMQWLARPYRDSAYAQYAVAVTALQADEIDEAQERILQAIELKPDWMRPHLLHGRLLMFQGKTDEAIDYVARLIGDDPQPDPDARMELALIMMSAGRNDDALSQVNQIAYETGNNPDALRLMAIINFREEHLDAAQEDFESLLASGRHTMDALFYLARIADYREDTGRAIRLYSRVTEGMHAVDSQRRAAALIAYRNDQPEEAIELLDKFAEDHPREAIDILFVKARLVASLERYDEALVFYEQLVAYRPGNENAMLGRGDLLLRLGRLDDAVAQYREAVEHFPESALSLNALGYTLADRTEEYREAERLIRKALTYNPESPAIIDSLGWVLFKLGQYEEALVELQRAYEGLDDPEVAAHIVEVLHALNRSDEALEFLLAAEEKTPENPLLQDVRERLFADAN